MASATTHTANGDESNTPISILTISLAKHLHGHDVADVIAQDWNTKTTPEQRSRFDNQGFNLDPTDVDGTLAALRDRLQEKEKKWDGVIVGWCTRGNKQFTGLFEKVVGEIVREEVRMVEQQQASSGGGDRGMKLMFSNGPDDLVNTTLRAFG